MSDVYIVISVNGNSVPEVCEVYSDKQQAFGRAAALAHFVAIHNPEWDTSPKEKVDVHGNQHWVFLKTSQLFNMHFVGVYCSKLEEKVSIKHNTDKAETLLISVWSNHDNGIQYKDLVTALGPRDPADFLVEVLDRSDLLNWRRSAAATLREHWAVSGQITVAGLDAHWKYSVGQLSHDPDEFERLIHAVCVLGDNIIFDKISKQVLQLHQVGDALQRHWATSANFYLKSHQLKAVTKQAVIPPVPVDNPADPSLPFGWTYGGNPVTTANVITDPYNVVSVYSLKIEQQWALVTVRIQKRPAFTIYVPGMGNCDQLGALNALRNKTNLGQEILMLECIWLDKFLNNAKGEDEESSSEESSEDY